MSIYAWGQSPNPAVPIDAVDYSGSERMLVAVLSSSYTASGDLVTRLYRHQQGLEITVNAAWTGSSWKKDVGVDASRVRFERDRCVFHMHNGATSTFLDSQWTGDFAFQPSGSASAALGSNAVLQGPGQTEAFVGQQCRTATSGNTNIGSGCTFHKSFPATPSSVTFTMLASSSISGGPYAYQTTSHGTGVFCNTTASGNTAYFYARAFAS